MKKKRIKNQLMMEWKMNLLLKTKKLAIKTYSKVKNLLKNLMLF